MPSNLGKAFERLIEMTNRSYSAKGAAMVDKVPTPVTTKSVNGRVVGAKYTQKSTVDFTGVIAGGRHIAFDTKETRDKNIHFRNFKPHQIEHLKKVGELGGVAFFLIHFRGAGEIYLLTVGEVEMLKESIGRQSIPLEWFRMSKEAVQSANGVPVDYLGRVMKDAL